MKNNNSWFDAIIEEQKSNSDILNDVCQPWTASELQEFIEKEF